MHTSIMKILVAGMVAAHPHQGGATSAVLQYVRGLERLGHEVWLVDPAEPTAEAGAYFAALDLGSRVFLGRYHGPVPHVLLNVSGMLRDERVLSAAPIRVYLDLDPVFNQLWHLQGVDAGLDGHTHYVTVGRRVPPTGHDWISTLPPIVLGDWPVAERIETDAFTTVANFRAYGSIDHEGVRYGQKAHSLRPLVDLPRLTDERFALALDIHLDEPDLATLREHGWELLDPREVAGTPERYASFVRGSKAELGIAKEGYVVSRSGWFGDRSAAYLASGRPVVAQDTGFGERLPVGAGLFAFADTDGVLAAIEAIRFDYARHARAARAVAEEHLDSRVVLTRLLREVGALPASAGHRSVHEATDAELAELLGVPSGKLRRRPFEYRSSAPLVELDADGRALLLKDLSPGALTERARAAKLDFLHDPSREVAVYRSFLEGAGLDTPALAGAVVEPDLGRYWLVVEKVEGAPLYQAQLERWHEVARWLARLHDRFAGTEASGSLVRYDRAYFELWPERAGVHLPGYGAVIDRLAGAPPTLVHGELYPSNVLLAGDRVCVVDWELAGAGPAALDLAALALGLDEDDAAAVAETYRVALADPPEASRLAFELDCARLHLAIQWLGWSSDWTPPPEHARDWRAELPRLVERVGL
jgi:fructose-specific component phosphotransferase system IIB-like protein